LTSITIPGECKKDKVDIAMQSMDEEKWSLSLLKVEYVLRTALGLR
jgi:hypothetical protein